MPTGTPLRTPSRPPHTRPAFALNGWILFGFLLLVGLCVWRAFLMWSSLPPASPMAGNGAYQAGVRLGIWAAPVVVPLIVLALAWVVGWLVSLMFGKSDDAGNIGAGLVMLGVLSLYVYGMYATLTAPPPAAGPPAIQAAASPDPGESARRLSEENRQRMDDLAERGRKQAEALHEDTQRRLEALRNGQPPPPPSTVLPSPAATPAGSPSAAPPPPSQPENPAIRPATEAFETELNAQIDDLIAKAGKVMPDLARAPAHDLTRIKARTDVCESLRLAAEAVNKLLRNATDDLTSRLQTAGLREGEARMAAMRWAGFSFKTDTRGWGAQTVARLCDKSKEECEFLQDNFGKWTLDSKGEVNAKDFQISSRARSLRFFVKADVDRRAEIENQLQGR